MVVCNNNFKKGLVPAAQSLPTLSYNNKNNSKSGDFA